jgi:hypothetical protein
MTPSSSASLLARSVTPEDLGAIRLTCLEKEIDLELSLEKWQGIRLEEPWVSTPPGAPRHTAWRGRPEMSRMSAKGYQDYLPAVRLRAAS